MRRRKWRRKRKVGSGSAYKSVKSTTDYRTVTMKSSGRSTKAETYVFLFLGLWPIIGLLMILASGLNW